MRRISIVTTTDRTILMLCGSLRRGSTNEAALRTAETLLPAGVSASRYTGLAALPHFNPDDDFEPLPPAVVDLRARIQQSAALLICTPEYAGALPGSFKNLLDWTVGGVEISDKPTAWLNIAGHGSPAGGQLAHDSLRAVLTYTGARIVDAACARIPVARGAIGKDGLIEDKEIRQQIAAALAILIDRIGPIEA
jgi:chromate reductase, NAD(P)H dehydrogenase (quinone)